MRSLSLSVIVIAAACCALFVFMDDVRATFLPVKNNIAAKQQTPVQQITSDTRYSTYIPAALTYAQAHVYNDQLIFIADMQMSSGKKRFFVYNTTSKTIITKGIVAHGSCNTAFLQDAKFSNSNGCGCSSFGKYKVGYKYKGRFGDAYRLTGLDSSNSNAFERNIVLHSYYAVPDNEVYPQPVCNSLGCIMVSENFLKELSRLIDKSKKPVLLWVLN